MATWKKIVVSGSNVSQLNNDAGYLTAGTLGGKNAFSTASFNGTNLVADSQSGSLNFASASGEGLTISANAGTDTLTFGLSAIPNASLANSSVLIGGQTITLGAAATTTLTGMASITSTSFTGSLQGTASYAIQALSASFASTAPYSGLTGVPAGIVSGSSQVTALLPAGTVSGSSQIDYSGITGVPAGIVSASVLTSPAQGQVVLTTNGVAGSPIDLGLETTDSPTFNSLQLNGNLTVVGTASFQNTQNLLVGDRFVLFASGSTSTGDGGFVVQQDAQNVGELFGWNSTALPLGRWAVTSSFNATNGTYTADAFMAAVTTLASANPNTAGPAGRYNAVGNIYVSSGDDSIWIYS
jgi:hypothetical protein